MATNVSDVTLTSTNEHKRDFQRQPLAMKLMNLFVAPAVLGIVTGLFLGISAPVYWVLQAVATIGGFLAGTEHVGWKEGFGRGIIGGSVFGFLILLTRAITGWDDKASLGDLPIALVLVTMIVGAIVGALGGAVRARRGRA